MSLKSTPGSLKNAPPTVDALAYELFSNSFDSVLLLDAAERIVRANPRSEVLLGARERQLVGVYLSALLPVGSPLLALLANRQAEEPLRIEVELVRIDGGFVTVEAVARRLRDGSTLLICRDTTLDRTAGDALAWSERRFRALVQNSTDITVVLDGKGAVSYVSPAASRLGLNRTALSEAQLWRSIHPRDRPHVREAMTKLLSLGETRDPTTDRIATVSSTFRFRVEGRWRWFEVEGADLRDDLDVRGLVLNVRDATEKIQSANRLRASEAYYRALIEKSFDGVWLLDEDHRVRSASSAALRMLGHDLDEIKGMNSRDLIAEEDRDAFFDALDMAEAVPGGSESVNYRVYDINDEPRWLEGSVTNLLDDPDVRAFVVNFREISERVRALEEIQNLNSELTRRLTHLQSLRRIDMAITNSFEVRMVLDIFLDQLMQDLVVPAAAILLYDASLQVLNLNAAKGFAGDVGVRGSVPLGEGPAGEAALDHRSVFLPDLAQTGERGVAVDVRHLSDYASYMAVPMLAKGQLQGVIEIYSVAPLQPTDEWLEFLETYADQGAIAIENAQLFRSLERSNIELQRAYDRTIEGWANALDLKDQETAGHSKRVTDMTMRLARRLGMPSEEIVHIQRGALLHDIGKMGIPDNILLKPGKLTDEEFEVMRQHPVFAYELISPIDFLKPALDIPYCHHEKWNGTGYPRGLKGEQIPLAARIFAVVDVFDALTSDRPYRSAWTTEKALEHIREGSGSHFDARVVEVFFEVMAEDAAVVPSKPAN
ncbi:MAG: PAS domain S-box protein [Trueperaceae bacterium]|nr:PAS domain S-box protein [Trueperaceae bacterium]